MESLDPIRKEILVERPAPEAFKIWTEGMTTWWPFRTHSVGGAQVRGCALEPRAGGRLYEIWDDGSERDWAQVIAFDPPHRLVLAWRPNPDRAAPTEVEVRFIAEVR